MRRRSWWLFLAAAAGVGALALFREPLLDAVLDARYRPAPPRFDAAPPRDAADATRQDLDYLALLPAVDRSFTPETRAEFARRVERLRANAAALTRAQFVLGVAEAVAAADNGHTNVELGSIREMLDSVPVRFAWFADGLYVVRARSAYRALLGARVVSIDGLAPEALDRDAARRVGGTTEHAHAWSAVLLESPLAINALHPEAPADRLVVQVVEAAGAVRTVELPSVAPADTFGASVPARLLSPVPLGVEKGTDWQGLLPVGDTLPPSLREPRTMLYSTRLAGGRVLYLHLWQVRDDDRRSTGAAIAEAAGPATEPPWWRIVLDLRFDGGGDYTTVHDAIRALPSRLAPDGRLLILTDNTTFSAAIVAAAWAKHYAGGQATVVGEKIGDRLAFWAEGPTLKLPNSGLPVYAATGYHDWAHGCRELRCFWPNYWYDVAAGSLDPDVPVGWRFDDYRRGVDTVLERALAL